MTARKKTTPNKTTNDKSVEVVTGEVDAFTESELTAALEDFCIEYNIDDLKKATQNQWHGAMTAVCRRIFADKLKLRPRSFSPTHNGGMTHYNAVDPVKLERLLDWYIFQSDAFDKVSTLRGFINLVGIDYSVLYGWLNDRGYSSELTPARSAFVKRLREAEEDSLTAVGITGKRIPTGALEALNYRYGHNMPGVSREVSQTRRTPEEIAAAHGVEIAQNPTPAALPAASFVDSAQ